MKIKIKYLDDSQREVHARLTDKLGGFKRVHFAGDMSDDRTVRLIFNGHVLNADSQTLEQGRSTYSGAFDFHKTIFLLLHLFGHSK